MSTTRSQRDRLLEQDIRELLGSHCELQAVDVEVRVQGGVAHLHGAVPSPELRGGVRHVVGLVEGVHAVWDFLRVDGEAPLRLLDLGCGGSKQHPEAIGVDRHCYDGVDLLAHLERPLPFTEQAFDKVFAVHFLEHVHDLLGLMNEIHRVLKPGGILHVIVPNHGFVNAVADPTHVRFFHRQTFKFFCRPHPKLRQYRPLRIGEARQDVYADLQPVKPPESPPSESSLYRYFD